MTLLECTNHHGISNVGKLKIVSSGGFNSEKSQIRANIDIVNNFISSFREDLLESFSSYAYVYCPPITSVREYATSTLALRSTDRFHINLEIGKLGTLLAHLFHGK